MSTEIFKVGDPVFDIRYGWGVVNVTEDCISVQFINDYIGYSYPDINLLSFTEYDLVNGGWSQDRSVLNQPKKGQLVYVRDEAEEQWKMRFFSHKEGKLFHCFVNQTKQGTTTDWNYMEIENPLLKEKE